jgi:hypothetical protein
MIHAPPVQNAIATQAPCLASLRQALSRLAGPASRFMRALRSPSIRRSTHMNRSVHTVCGQA